MPTPSSAMLTIEALSGPEIIRLEIGCAAILLPSVLLHPRTANVGLALTEVAPGRTTTPGTAGTA